MRRPGLECLLDSIVVVLAHVAAMAATRNQLPAAPTQTTALTRPCQPSHRHPVAIAHRAPGPPADNDPATRAEPASCMPA